MPSATPMTSRWPVSSTPMVTGMLTVSTDPPQTCLSPHPSTNGYGYECSDRGRFRHRSMSSYTRSSLSESVREGIRSPHKSLPVSVDLTGQDAGQVHVDQSLLDALLPPPVAVDHRRLEQGALQFRHLQR